MKPAYWAVAGVIVAISLVAGAFSTIELGNEMKTVHLTIHVEERLKSSGGVVYVLPVQITASEFNARYADALEMSPPKADQTDQNDARLNFKANIGAPVSFVLFDTPENDYSYSFIVEGEGAEPVDNFREAVVSVGGSGFRNLDTGSLMDNVPMITHHIDGREFSVDIARVFGNQAPRFSIALSSCRTDIGTRVCEPSQSQIEDAVAYAKISSSRD